MGAPVKAPRPLVGRTAGPEAAGRQEMEHPDQVVLRVAVPVQVDRSLLDPSEEGFVPPRPVGQIHVGGEVDRSLAPFREEMEDMAREGAVSVEILPLVGLGDGEGQARSRTEAVPGGEVASVGREREAEVPDVAPGAGPVVEDPIEEVPIAVQVDPLVLLEDGDHPPTSVGDHPVAFRYTFL